MSATDWRRTLDDGTDAGGHIVPANWPAHLDPDAIPTRAELDRDDAEPPVPPARRNGHTVVLRYLNPPEPIVHLQFDGHTTLCGQPWEWRVQTSPHPTCEACMAGVGGDAA
jgi:hypothetical protein